MYQENTLYDIYQTIIGFGSYIRIQYLSNQVSMELDFGDCYEVDFQEHYGNDELTINSKDSSTIIAITKYDKINIIEYNDAYMIYEIKIHKDTYLIITIEL